MQYDHQGIEEKWQKEWRQRGTYRVSNDTSKPKYYVLDMFPYPSGAGLHVGHPLGYIASDIVARYKRHSGFNVLHPMGYDSFGLPAEQYAIQTGQHPAKTTEENTARYRQQLDRIGFSFDWERQVFTSDPSYYKWTQWIFIQLFESWYDPKADQARPISELIACFEQNGSVGQDTSVLTGDIEEFIGGFSANEWKRFDERTKQMVLQHFRLAYLSEAWVNWCPALGTVLANDEVKDGVSERGGHPVERKRMPQWSMRITAYAQRLLDGLDTLNWSESIKEAQRNWIGRSEGALVRFALTPSPSPVEKGTMPPSWAERPGYLTADRDMASKLHGHALEMRKESTGAEDLLWQQLRGNATGGRIRRQHVIDRYIVDLVSLPKRLVIEVDGSVHKGRSEEDAARTERLKELGFDVIRFANDEVLEELPRVVDTIKGILAARPDVTDQGAYSSPSPSEKGLGDEGVFIEVFTTRPDTLFGVSFLTIAPEHELVAQLTTDDRRAEVEAYVKVAKNRSERDRQAEVDKVSGVFTGSYAKHPFTGADVPVWVGDYVLAGYGTGAVMAVPGGDQRDWRFAKHFALPIIAVTEGADIDKEADERKDATIISEGFLQGLKVPQAITRAIEELERIGAGQGRINFRLRDAAFGRQRYWGEPIPIYYKNDIPYALPESELPLKLPEVDKFLPTEDGEPPLARAKNWHYSPSPSEKGQGDEGPYPLETTTMPGWAGSSWYFLRYMDPKNEGRFASPEAINYWQQVDLYVGGSEHATGHLLYFRFWTKFLKDRGYINFDEPAKKLVNQGMIQGVSAKVLCMSGASFESDISEIPLLYISTGAFTAMVNANDYSAVKEVLSELNKGFNEEVTHIDVARLYADIKFVSSSDELNMIAFRENLEAVGEERTIRFITERNETFLCIREVEKMSKSKYNVVNPDEIISKYGADTLRLYEMFLGPLEQSKPWDTNGIEGTFRFLRKFWNLFHADAGGASAPLTGEAPVASTHRVDTLRITEDAPTKAELKILHATIKKVSEDIEKMSFNTSVAQFMIAVNELGALKCNKREVLEPLTVILAPFAPHIAEELWEKLGHNTSVITAVWPAWDAQYLVEDNFSYPISFNGKTRLQLEFPIALDAKSVEAAVLANPEVQQRLEGKSPKKVIVVPKRIVNIVV